jgi:hypothetical protein
MVENITDSIQLDSFTRIDKFASGTVENVHNIRDYELSLTHEEISTHPEDCGRLGKIARKSAPDIVNLQCR